MQVQLKLFKCRLFESNVGKSEEIENFEEINIDGRVIVTKILTKLCVCLWPGSMLFRKGNTGNLS